MAPTAEKFCPSEESKLIFTGSMKKGEFARPHKDWMKEIAEMNNLFNSNFPLSVYCNVCSIPVPILCF